MTKSFLPDNYEIPQTPSNYMRFQEGSNRFRILASAVTGFEYFSSDNKPHRSKEPFESTPDLKKDGRVKAFWAFPVFNYENETIQILELTQKTLMNAIKGYVENEKWGAPFFYDLCVTKTGEGLETEYQVQAEPPIGEVADEIKQAYKEKTPDLEKLFTGEDPWAK